jgi:uncharacterized membrane protein HdeD (DUF308 family)
MNVETGGMSMEAAKKGSGLAAALGVFLIILGVLAVLEPLYAGASFTVLLALLLIGAGIVKLVWAFGARSAGAGVITFVFGVLTMLVGLYMLARPGIAMATLTLVLAVYFFLSGISEILYAFKLESGHCRQIMMANSTLTIPVNNAVPRPLSSLNAYIISEMPDRKK